MTPLSKHIWLINLLRESSSGLTFDEINKRWIKSRRGTEDENMPILKRTFHNHIKAIREEYGIDIVCGQGYRYYIDDPFNDVASKIERITVFNMIKETVFANRSLFVEDYFIALRDNAVVSIILDAIRTKRKIRLQRRLGLKSTMFDSAPYQLHHLRGSWYLMGKEDNLGLMRIPLLLYYVRDVTLSDESFQFPLDYSSEEYGKKIYGTTNEMLHVEIRVSRTYYEELKLLDKYPLMPFNQMIEYGYPDDKSAKVEIDMPNTPFALEILHDRLTYYYFDFEILNEPNPLELFTQEQFENEKFEPVVL